METTVKQPAANKTRRRLSGTVVAAKMNKTVVVAVYRQKLHPIYQKRYRVTKKYHAHVADGTLAVGDKVVIEETRPLSKTKRWRVVPTNKK